MGPRNLLYLLAVVAMVLPTAAVETAEPAAPAGSQPPVDVRMGEVEIKGEIERPGVFYIIPRREVEMDLGRQTRDYTPELSRPLDPAAFERWVRLQQTAR